jgi:hypothetical protein
MGVPEIIHFNNIFHDKFRIPQILLEFVGVLGHV